MRCAPRSKIEAGLYQATDLCVEPSLARNLVNLLPIQANTDASQSEALQLLAAVAGHPDMSRQLVSLGALDYLEELQRGGGAIGDGAAAAARMLLSQRVEFDDGRTPPRIVSPSKTTAAPAASRSLQSAAVDDDGPRRLGGDAPRAAVPGVDR